VQPFGSLTQRQMDARAPGGTRLGRLITGGDTQPRPPDARRPGAGVDTRTIRVTAAQQFDREPGLPPHQLVTSVARTRKSHIPLRLRRQAVLAGEQASTQQVDIMQCNPQDGSSRPMEPQRSARRGMGPRKFVRNGHTVLCFAQRVGLGRPRLAAGGRQPTEASHGSRRDPVRRKSKHREQHTCPLFSRRFQENSLLWYDDTIAPPPSHGPIWLETSPPEQTPLLR
jgi:hypothetical protein